MTHPISATAACRATAAWLGVLVVLAACSVSDPDAPDDATTGDDATTSPATGAPADAEQEVPQETAPPEPAAVEDPVVPAFDETSMVTLFLEPDDLAATIPAAAAGVESGAGSDDVTWGLTDGATIEPVHCSPVHTVVTQEPNAFAARAWTMQGVDVVQRVTVLADEVGARTAFDTLRAAVDRCLEYSLVAPGADGGTWRASPSTSVQDPFPAVWQERVLESEGVAVPELHGHVLVGNAIVTWRAAADTAQGAVSADALGSGGELDAMVQSRALRAADALP